jgi:hypothetical protein
MSRTKTEKDNAIKKMKLPNELIAIKNADKEFHEVWSPNRNPLNFPHPFRLVALGPPNVGKSTTIKNIILRAKPMFDEVYIIHCDPDGTKEYNDIGAIFLPNFPDPQSWNSKGKKLVIIDDVELKSLSKDQMKNLDRLFGYSSTHQGISVCLCSQDPFNVPSIVRRCASIFILWRGRDLDSMSTTARKSGLRSKEMTAIFDQLMTNFRDSLWIDLTTDSPFPLRRNGFELISKISESDDTKKFVESFDKFEVD